MTIVGNNNTIRTVESNIAVSQQKQEKIYWEEKHNIFLNSGRIPYDKSITEVSDEKTSELEFSLNTQTEHEILELAKDSDYRLFIIVSSLVSLLINQYSRNNLITIKTVIDKQEKEGDFMNTILPVSCDLSNSLSIREVFNLIKTDYISAVKNQNFPISEYYYKATGNQLSALDTGVVLTNFQSETYFLNEKPKLLFVFTRENDKLLCRIEYNCNLYNQSTINALFEQLSLLFDLASFNLDTLISEISLLSEVDKEKQIKVFNNTQMTLGSVVPLNELFDIRANRTPDKIALVHSDQSITYKLLQQRSDNLANYIMLDLNVRKAQIGVLCNNSIDMVIAIISILKSGSAYVPLDLNAPQDRKNTIVRDCNIQLILTDVGGDEIEGVTMIDLRDKRKIISSGDSHYDQNIDNPAYIMYTSGTTNKPKGIPISHTNIVNQLIGLENQFCFKSDFHHVLMANLTFDPSVQQIFLPLLTNGTLHLISKERQIDVIALSNYISSRCLNVFNTVPTVMNNLLINNDLSNLGHKIDIVILAGELFSRRLYKKLIDSHKIREIINIYGPTEATINTTSYLCQDNEKGIIPIGTPLPNYEVYILNENKKILPIGMPGEIAIAGKGIAKGYLNDPENSAVKFFSSKELNGKILYLTGDLGKWNENGYLEFISRIDRQIKLNGIRIEIEEIENAISSIKEIKEAVVLLKKVTNNDILCCYYVEEQPIEEMQIIEALRRTLLDVMIPKSFTKIEKIPFTKNGKIDTKLLPDPLVQTNFMVPSSSIEKELEEIWKKILEIDSVSVNADFFLIGGDSIKSINLLNRINKHFNANFTLPDLVINRTILSFAKKLENIEGDNNLIEKEKIEDELQRLKNNILSKE